MPSASPGTSVKKPDPNIKSMYPVSVESGLVLGLSSVGIVWLDLEGRDSWAVFFPKKGCFPHPLSQGEGACSWQRPRPVSLLESVALAPDFV